MTVDVLFLQGAGDGAHDEDALLAGSLQKVLGAGYRVRYPRMRQEGEPEYPAWKEQIEHELAGMQTPAAVVGRSVGGSVLLKYLTEAEDVAPIAGAFVLAAPYWGADAFWSWDAGQLSPDAARRLGRIPDLYLYHARDDDIVPFSHLALYAAALPRAVVREVDGGGHQFGNDLTDVARDIARLIPDSAER